MASQMSSQDELDSNSPAAMPQPQASPASSAEADRFAMPVRSRPPALAPLPALTPLEQAERVGAASPSPQEAAEILQREAKARLLALRRIEWVALALVAVLLGGAALSWRSESDVVQARRDAFNGAPVPFGGPIPFGGPGGRWKPAPPAQARAARAAIQTQLDAFKRDDFATAVKIQSRMLRNRFASASEFRQMIREQFPAFVNFSRVSFGRSFTGPDGSPLQMEVILLGPKGEATGAIYSMVREGGAFRVEGVSPFRNTPDPPRAPQRPNAPSAPATEA